MNNDLISRNKLKEDLIKFFPTDCLDGIESKTLFNQILHDIDNEPTVEKRPQGEWIDTGKFPIRWKCSNCGRRDQYIYNYCPNCGSYNRGE